MSADPSDFAGLRVAAFESRRTDDMARLIERRGGRPHVSPSMREVPLDENPAAARFAAQLVEGTIDVVVLLTGVGTRQLVAQAEAHVDRDRLLAAFAAVTTVARGPKPVAACKGLGFTPTVIVPEPNTWRELLATLDRQLPVAGKTVAVQEYGLPNAELVAGLEARGATVESVKVYRWELPDDTRPLADNIRAIAAHERDVALFTSAHQVTNLLRMAEGLQLTEPLREAMKRMVVASIGPTTSEMLRECGLPVDLEPEHSKMGHLVSAAAERSAAMLAGKSRVSVAAVEPPRGDEPLPPWHDSPFMKACRREPCDQVPIWLMRQAGRYMAEYRALRENITFLEFCKDPKRCTEAMVTAVERLGVDAAIIFADLLPILEPMGLDLEFAVGEGPIIHNPLRAPSDLDRFVELEDVGSLGFVMETVKLTRAAISDRVPILGFAGAPFTLASYAIEGGASRHFQHTKAFMYRDPVAWHDVLGRLARSVVRYLNAQVAAGAQAVQIFDSWAGCLGPDDYRRYVLPHTKTVIDGVAKGVPVINFATGNPALLPLLSEAGGAVIGVDWRVRLDDAWRTVGYNKGVQGNLDPIVLLSTQVEIRRRAAEVLEQAAGRPGHIFNLGHGILPETPVENAIALVEAVHELGPARPR